MSGLLILGAGGHGKVVADIAQDCGLWDKIAFLDDKYPSLQKVCDWAIVGVVSDFASFHGEYSDALVAFGDNALRLEMTNRLLAEGFQVPRLIHPDASISRLTEIGEGTVICAQAAIKIDTRIGKGVIINAGSTIGHDCTVGDGVHVSPGARVSGGVVIGDRSWMGSGSIAKEGVTIGHGVVVGAGTVVIRDVPNDVTVVGVPGKIIKRHQDHDGEGEYR